MLYRHPSPDSHSLEVSFAIVELRQEYRYGTGDLYDLVEAMSQSYRSGGTKVRAAYDSTIGTLLIPSRSRVSALPSISDIITQRKTLYTPTFNLLPSRLTVKGSGVIDGVPQLFLEVMGWAKEMMTKREKGGYLPVLEATDLGSMEQALSCVRAVSTLLLITWALANSPAGWI
jgi:hypothetical protein